jgi:chromosome segregation ATPase
LKSYGDSLKKSTSLQLRFSDAQKSEKKSLATLTDANNDLASAQARLAQIERGFGVGSPEALAAQADLAKAQRSQERAVYAVEEAVFSVADAEKNLAEIRKDPESSPMDIRRAEINLAEAKLSVADATDSQAESTKELNDQQRLLNDAIFGATVGSILYDQALRDVEDATRQQVSAYEAWEEAVTNTKTAQDEFNKSLQATADLIRKYPKVLGGMPNPMANLVPDSTLANNASSLFNGGGMGTVNIEVNAGLGASGIEIGQEIDQYLREYLGFSGQTFSFGSIGNFVGVR